MKEKTSEGPKSCKTHVVNKKKHVLHFAASVPSLFGG